MAGPEQNQGNPEVGQEPGSFPLRLSSGPENRTIVWSIAGFDPSSGAGITADLMTFAAHGLFGCSAITALTVQSTLGVFGWEPVGAGLLRASLDRLVEDLAFAGLKIGMLGQKESASVVSTFLQKHRTATKKEVVLLDPVLRSSSGKSLFPEEGISLLHGELLPQVDWITPNWAELSALTGVEVRDLASAERAARQLLARHPQLHVVATGGDQQTPIDLLLQPDGEITLFRGELVETRSTHGTGCAFSSSLLAHLVLGATPDEAVRRAKHYVIEALRAAPGIGGGRGPLGLLWPLRGGTV